MDEIENFIYQNSQNTQILQSINEQCSFILNYLTEYFLISKNIEKINKFYLHFPSIISILLSNKIETFEDFLSLYNLLSFNEGNVNFFHIVVNPPFNIVKTYKVEQKLLNNKKVNQKLLQFLSSDINTKSKQNEFLFFDIFEYYLIHFLLTVKNYNIECVKFLNITDDNHILRINKERSFQVNLFKSLFDNYLQYLNNVFWSKRMLFFLSFINEIWLTEYYDYSVHIEEISKLQQKKLHFSQNVISSVSKPQYPNLLIVSCINSLIPLLHEHYFELSNIIDNIFRCLFYFMKFSFTYLSNIPNQKGHYLNELGNLLYSYLIPRFDNVVDQKKKEKNIKDFFFLNLPFYTELTNDLIINYDKLTYIKNEDWVLFLNLLNLISPNTNKEGIFQYISFDLMKNYSEGKTKYYSGDIQIDQMVNSLQTKKEHLFPFSNKENKKYILNILKNIKSILTKINNDANKNMNQHLSQVLEEIYNKLSVLYSISGKLIENNATQQKSKKLIHLSKTLKLIQKSPWELPKNQEENEFLFLVMKTTSYIVDYFRGIRNEKVPVTNLRPFCNYFNFLKIFIFIIIFSSLIFIIYSTSQTKLISREIVY